jgi:hypothetical protein
MVLHQHDCILFMGKDTLIVFKHNNAHALRGVKDVLVVSHLPSNNTYYGTNVQQQAGPVSLTSIYQRIFSLFPLT